MAPLARIVAPPVTVPAKFTLSMTTPMRGGVTEPSLFFFDSFVPSAGGTGMVAVFNTPFVMLPNSGRSVPLAQLPSLLMSTQLLIDCAASRRVRAPAAIGVIAIAMKTAAAQAAMERFVILDSPHGNTPTPVCDPDITGAYRQRSTLSHNLSRSAQTLGGDPVVANQ